MAMMTIDGMHLRSVTPLGEGLLLDVDSSQAILRLDPSVFTQMEFVEDLDDEDISSEQLDDDDSQAEMVRIARDLLAAPQRARAAVLLCLAQPNPDLEAALRAAQESNLRLSLGIGDEFVLTDLHAEADLVRTGDFRLHATTSIGGSVEASGGIGTIRDLPAVS